ncbi:unnamed protein product [Auanema sp. JU1783]|nr:unnamed protein product [Auanema sp. JU1783]
MEVDLVNPDYELLDPCPDIHALFLEYNQKFFQGKLLCCELKWSARMTTCAGVCSYEGRSGFCSIRLSKPLLTLRPRKDLVETLLHEMIHAFLFITANNRDRDGHGPEFQFHMHRINKLAGTNITIYHTFHAEVAVYKTHWWRCNGSCQHQKPFYGFVKRASNRAPGPNDRWWPAHKASCNGTFIKIKEPDDYGKKTKKDESKSIGSQKQSNENKKKSVNTLDNWIKGNDKSFDQKNQAATDTKLVSPVATSESDNENPSTSTGLGLGSTVFSGTGAKLGGSNSVSALLSRWDQSERTSKSQISKKEIEVIDLTQGTLETPNHSASSSASSEEQTVLCPVCSKQVLVHIINSHLDRCLQ